MPAAAAATLLQSCSTLCNPIDSSPPGSPVPGILQARTLEWVAISFSKVMPKVPQISFGSMFFMHPSLSLTFEVVNKEYTQLSL